MNEWKVHESILEEVVSDAYSGTTKLPNTYVRDGDTLYFKGQLTINFEDELLELKNEDGDCLLSLSVKGQLHSVNPKKDKLTLQDLYIATPFRVH
jgi:hypothetical protein